MLEQLEALLRIVEPFGEDLPPECNNASTEAWSVFEILVTKYGGLYFVLERVTRVLRFGIQFFNINAITVIPSVLATFTASFQKTGLSSCMWIFSKIIQQISESSSPATKQAIRQAYDGMSLKVAALLSSSPAKEHPDSKGPYRSLLRYVTDE
jgi:transportin-3